MEACLHPAKARGHRATTGDDARPLPASRSSRTGASPGIRLLILLLHPATDDEGLGLGLSIVAAIVRAHRVALTAKPGTHGGLDIEIGFPAVASQAAFAPGIR
jgi:hypothetical protein